MKLNNHVDINIVYNEGKTPDSVLIIGFEVNPRSIQYDTEEWNKKSVADKESGVCPSPIDGEDGLYIPEKIEDNTVEVVWTYSVQWEKTDIKWTQRWDMYQHS